MHGFQFWGAPECAPGTNASTCNMYGHVDKLVTEMVLDPELLSTLCRRSRRRLRDIQINCQVTMKIDRMRGTLRMSGSEAAIQAAQKQLSSLGGPRKPVTASVWAELMRTRTMQSSTHAIVARLQDQSGCRIHIERSRQEVRIFGPREGVVVADKLLDDFALACIEEVVPVSNSAALASAVLQQVARGCGVTLRIEEQQIVVLGLSDAVKGAVEELKSYIAEPNAYRETIAQTAGGKLALHDADGTLSESDPQTQEFADMCQVEDDQFGMVTSELPGAVAATRTPRSSEVHSPKIYEMNHNSCRTCPTCGVGRFCVFCGSPTWQNGGSMNVDSCAAALGARVFQKSSMSSGSKSRKSWGPDSDVQAAPWPSQAVFMPYEGDAGQSAAGAGSMGVVPGSIVPVCFSPNPGQNGNVYMVPAAMFSACMMPASGTSHN